MMLGHAVLTVWYLQTDIYFPPVNNLMEQNLQRKCNNCQIKSNFPFFKFMWPCILTNFFTIKPTRCTNFPNLFRHETLHVSGSSSAHHQEFIHCTLGTGICHTGLKETFEQDQDGTGSSILVLFESCIQTCMAYNSAECTLNKLLMMGRGTARNM